MFGRHDVVKKSLRTVKCNFSLTLFNEAFTPHVRVRPEIQTAILSLLATDTTISTSEREQWRAKVSGCQLPKTAPCPDADDALTNDEAAQF
jgi:hypothetical protein